MKLSIFTIALATISSVSGNSIFPEKKSCADNRFCAGTPTTSKNTDTNTNTNTPSSLDTTLSLRGGEVIEPATLGEVDDIIMRASAQGQLVVIDFSATWCGPCQAIGPLYKKLSTEYTNIVFLKVDVDENPETAAKYQVAAMPTFLFIKRGEVVDKMMGANPDKLKDILSQY